MTYCADQIEIYTMKPHIHNGYSRTPQSSSPDQFQTPNSMIWSTPNPSFQPNADYQQAQKLYQQQQQQLQFQQQQLQQQLQHIQQQQLHHQRQRPQNLPTQLQTPINLTTPSQEAYQHHRIKMYNPTYFTPAGLGVTVDNQLFDPIDSLSSDVSSKLQMISRSIKNNQDISKNDILFFNGMEDSLDFSQDILPPPTLQSMRNQPYQLSPNNYVSVPTSNIDLNSPTTIDLTSPSLSESDSDSFSKNNSMADNIFSSNPFGGIASSTDTNSIEEILKQDPFLEIHNDLITNEDALVNFIENDSSIEYSIKVKKESKQAITSKTYNTSMKKLKKKSSRVGKKEPSKSSLETSVFTVNSLPIKLLKKSVSFSECSKKFPLFNTNQYSFVYENGTDEDLGVRKTKSQAYSRVTHQHYQYDYKNQANQDLPKVLKDMKSGLNEFQLNMNSSE